MEVCEAIARWCKDIETPFVAGILGNGLLEIADQLDQVTDVPWILTRHEQGAAMMAYSYAFQTGKPAVAVGSKAPGATNATIGVMGAFVESLPMVVITAQVANKHEHLEAFEEIDLVALYKPITKWSVQVNNPDRVLGLLHEAYKRATSGRPGPVHVSIPYDFMHHEIDEYIAPKLPVAGTNIRASSMRTVIDELSSAKRPLIIAGGGLPFKTESDLLAIAELIGAPIVSSWLRKPMADNYPNFVGMAGIGGSPASRSAIADADVILVLGCRFSEQMTEHYKMAFAKDSLLIHIDIDPAVIGRVYTTEIGIVGDLADLMPQLREAVVEVKPTTDDRVTWLSTLQAEHREYRGDLTADQTPGDEIGGRELVRAMRKLLPGDTRLVLDSGNYLHWAEQYFPINQAGQFHYPTSGTMGFGIPGAIGAKIAYPDNMVVALVGDGGFAMTMSELETAVRIETPILVIIVNNSTIGHIRMRQDANFKGRRVGTNFIKQHFAYVPKAFGAFSNEVESATQLEEVLGDAIIAVQSGQIAVVDVHVTQELASGPLTPWWND